MTGLAKSLETNLETVALADANVFQGDSPMQVTQLWAQSLTAISGEIVVQPLFATM